MRWLDIVRLIDQSRAVISPSRVRGLASSSPTGCRSNSGFRHAAVGELPPENDDASVGLRRLNVSPLWRVPLQEHGALHTYVASVIGGAQPPRPRCKLSRGRPEPPLRLHGRCAWRDFNIAARRDGGATRLALCSLKHLGALSAKTGR